MILIGEPTSDAVLGDTVKIGRRGSVNLWIDVPGTQGHVAYPHRADNPIPIPGGRRARRVAPRHGNERFRRPIWNSPHLRTGVSDHLIRGPPPRDDIRFNNLQLG